jgi:glutathione S-transferase
MMIELWGRETSSNVQAVRWALLELGLSFNRHDVGGAYGGLDTPEFRKLNPAGKIPVIVDEALVVFESAAILRYLGARYGSDSFWPEALEARTRVNVLAEWAKHDIADLFTGPVFWRAVRVRAELRDPAAIRAALDAFEASLAIAEHQLGRHEWLAGAQLTPGDIHLGHVLYRYFTLDIERRDFPALRAYYDRLTGRPAYREAVMISYASLRDTA